MSAIPQLDGRRWLNLTLRDSTGATLNARPWTITWSDGHTEPGATDAHGRLQVRVRSGATWADLTVAWRRFRLRLDALEPIETVVGLQARLNNLNFHAGPEDGVLGPRTAAAIRGFQRAHHCPETGEMTPETLHALHAAYGQ